MLTPGQKVVCINAEIPPYLRDEVKPLQAGQVYTVRGFRPGYDPENGVANVCAVYLEGVRNVVNVKGIENGYSLARFAPAPESAQPEQPAQPASLRPYVVSGVLAKVENGARTQHLLIFSGNATSEAEARGLAVQAFMSAAPGFPLEQIASGELKLA